MSIEQRVEAVLHDPNYVAVVSHRGDWRNWPENSLPAIESAIDMGVDMVEIDIKMTADSVLVVCHDGKINRTTTGRGSIINMTYDELMNYDLRRGHGVEIPGMKIPTLRQALEVCKGRAMVNVDQGIEYYDQVLALTEELGMTDQVLIKGGLLTNQVRVLMKMHEKNIPYMPVLDISKPGDTIVLAKHLDLNPVAVEMVFDTLNDLVKSAAKMVRDHGSKLWVNTLWGSLCGDLDDDRAYVAADPDSIYGTIIDLGTIIIQTDRPEFLIDYLEKRDLR